MSISEDGPLRLSFAVKLTSLPPRQTPKCKLLEIKDLKGMAERVGFEPTVGFLLHTLSKRAP